MVAILTSNHSNQCGHFGVKVQFRGPKLFKKKRGIISRRIVPTWYIYASMNKLAIRLWMDGLNLNVIWMFCRYDFAIRQPLHRHDSQSRTYQRPYRHVVIIALQRVIGCIATSSQRRRPKHGGLANRWGSTCHAYGRKYGIKIQCWWDEKYVNLMIWRPKKSRQVRFFLK